MNEFIYKVADEAVWAAAKEAGVYAGAPVDLKDGFIHFSTAAQLPGTLAKHFARRDGLVLLTIGIVALAAEGLGPALRWEASRAGDLFPHLYASLPVAVVVREHALHMRADDTHDLPPELG